MHASIPTSQYVHNCFGHIYNSEQSHCHACACIRAGPICWGLHAVSHAAVTYLDETDAPLGSVDIGISCPWDVRCGAKPGCAASAGTLYALPTLTHTRTGRVHTQRERDGQTNSK
eukprot:GDKI01027028.1.p2 GENE.GDKI01027028.1~~GDKI01027028.1.p2  ORF type:complete len:115 (-),score=15.58 GDKI01027028.1:224-568(-)